MQQQQQDAKLTHSMEQLIIDTPIGYMVVSIDEFANTKKFYVTPPEGFKVKTSTSGTTIIVDVTHAKS